MKKFSKLSNFLSVFLSLFISLNTLVLPLSLNVSAQEQIAPVEVQEDENIESESETVTIEDTVVEDTSLEIAPVTEEVTENDVLESEEQIIEDEDLEQIDYNTMWQATQNLNEYYMPSLVTNFVYTFPANNEVKIEFSTLSENGGDLTVTEVLLTDETVKSLNLASSKAYEFKSSMSNGSFSYTLTLPNPAGLNATEVKYAQNQKALANGVNEVETLELIDNYSITLTDLNHFTIFVIVNGGVNGTVTPPSCAGAVGSAGGISITGSDDCYNSINAAIAAANDGDTIYLGAGNYDEAINLNKRVNLVGSGSGTDPNVDTIITSTVLNSIILSVNASGIDSSNRILVSNLRLTGGTAASSGGNQGSGINIFTPSTGHLHFDNIASSNNAGHGIAINHTGNISDIYITNSTFDSNSGYGFRIPTSVLTVSDVLIENSVFTNNTLGGIGIRPSGGTGVSNVQIHNSHIVGNLGGGVLNWDSGFIVDAENNWWGSSAGPGAGGNNGITARVDADPWMLSLDPAPSQPVMLNIRKQSDDSVVLTCGVDTLGYTNTTQIKIEWLANPESDIAGYWFGTKFNDHHQYFNGVNNTLKTASMTPGNNPYYYTVIAVDNASQQSVISEACGDLILDQEVPVTTMTSPIDNSVWNSAIDFAGNTTDNFDVDQVNVYYRNAGSSDAWVLATTFVNGIDSASFDWSGSWLPLASGSFDFKVSGVDAAGNEEGSAYAYNVSFAIDTPVQIGYNVNDGTLAGQRPTQFACLGGSTDINGAAVNWTYAGGLSVKYQRQYRYDIGGGFTDWSGNEIYTNDYTNFRTFGGNPGNPGTYQSRVRAFVDTDNGNDYDAGELVSDWSNTCQIRFLNEQPEPETYDLMVCKEDQDANPVEGWNMSVEREGLSLSGSDVNEVVNNISGKNVGTFPAGIYEININGTYRYGSGLMTADAGYSYRPASLGAGNLGCDCWFDGDQLGYNNPAWTGALKIKINGANINWGVYNDLHSYTYYYNHAGGDIILSSYDNSYGDNVNIDMVINISATNSTQATAVDGCATFSDLLPGDYAVTEETRDGWEFDGRSDGFNNGEVVNLDSNYQLVFTNRKIGEINGYKWEDDNHDGVWDIGEVALEGWEITLNTGDTTLTDVDGYYSFDALDLGDYEVCESMQTNWEQTYPYMITADSCHDVTLTGADPIAEDTNFGNFKLAEIWGLKIDDLNGNADVNAGETGLENWEITLDGSTSIFTDVDGVYTFYGVGFGVHEVCEVMQDGWIQTFPINVTGNTCHTITVDQSGEVIYFADDGEYPFFYNFELATVSGYKWADSDNFGIWDAAEVGLENWEITATSSTQTFTTTTDSNGYYELHLPIGSYDLCETMQDGWDQSYPSSLEFDPICYEVNVTQSGQTFTDNNFGNTLLNFIQGRKFNDVNYNGLFDNEEQTEAGNPNRLNGWTITLYDSSWNYLKEMNAGDDSTTAGNVGKGQYRFVNLIPGNYYVCESHSDLNVYDEWVQTKPNVGQSYGGFSIGVDNQSGLGFDNCFEVNLPSGNIRPNGVQGVQFGNFELGEVWGIKFEDDNANGEINYGETGIENWAITLDGTQTVYTDSYGVFMFDNVSYGTHTLCEEIPTGWIQTYPISVYSSECHTVTVTQSGELVYMNDEGGYAFFYNFQLGSVEGYKWEDVNQNSIWDEGEEGLEGWTIVVDGDVVEDDGDDLLSRAEVSSLLTDVTDENGFYSISGLTYGSHTVCEVLQDGWVQTYPYSLNESQCHTIFVDQSGEVIDMTASENPTDFGNYFDLFPAVNITVTPGTSILAGTDVTLTANASGGNSPLSYQWSGDCNDSDSIDEILNANGTYTCTITVTDLDGDTATAEVTITTFNNVPTVVIIATPGVLVNSGTTVTLQGNILGGDPNFTYFWYGACSGSGSGSNGLTSTTTVPSNPGSYACGISVTDINGDTAQASVTVVVNAGGVGSGVLGTTDNEDEEEEDTDILGATTCDEEELATISGFVYVDLNDNNEIDENEGKAEVRVSIYYKDEEGEFKLLTIVRTDDEGKWELKDICPGEYEARLRTSDLANTESAGADVISFTINASENQDNLNFEVNVETTEDSDSFNWLLILLIILIALGLGGTGIYIYIRENNKSE